MATHRFMQPSLGVQGRDNGAKQEAQKLQDGIGLAPCRCQGYRVTSSGGLRIALTTPAQLLPQSTTTNRPGQFSLASDQSQCVSFTGKVFAGQTSSLPALRPQPSAEIIENDLTRFCPRFFAK